MNALQSLYHKHPNLLMWAVLSLGMVIILLLAARNVGFSALQWLVLVIATVGLAGLCTWIVSWEN